MAPQSKTGSTACDPFSVALLPPFLQRGKPCLEHCPHHSPKSPQGELGLQLHHEQPQPECALLTHCFLLDPESVLAELFHRVEIAVAPTHKKLQDHNTISAGKKPRAMS